MKQIALMVVLAFVTTLGFAADDKKPMIQKPATTKAPVMKNASAKKKSPEVTVTGYLVDVHCAKKLMEKNDVAIPARQHERSCAMMPECEASGYGVFVVVNKSATHASDVDFYTLNAAGNKMAKAVLEKSSKKDNVLVTVNGKGLIAADEILEVK